MLNDQQLILTFCTVHVYTCMCIAITRSLWAAKPQGSVQLQILISYVSPLWWHKNCVMQSQLLLTEPPLHKRRYMYLREVRGLSIIKLATFFFDKLLTLSFICTHPSCFTSAPCSRYSHFSYNYHKSAKWYTSLWRCLVEQLVPILVSYLANEFEWHPGIRGSCILLCGFTAHKLLLYITLDNLVYWQRYSLSMPGGHTPSLLEGVASETTTDTCTSWSFVFILLQLTLCWGQQSGRDWEWCEVVMGIARMRDTVQIVNYGGGREEGRMEGGR